MFNLPPGLPVAVLIVMVLCSTIGGLAAAGVRALRHLMPQSPEGRTEVLTTWMKIRRRRQQDLLADRRERRERRERKSAKKAKKAKNGKLSKDKAVKHQRRSPRKK